MPNHTVEIRIIGIIPLSDEKKYAKKLGVNIIFWHIRFREGHSIHVFMPNEREKADVSFYLHDFIIHKFLFLLYSIFLYSNLLYLSL